jgi:hypothetical protein
VLIVMGMQHVVMFGFILIALIAAFLPLAYLAGADSRVDDVARRRRYNG